MTNKHTPAPWIAETEEVDLWDDEGVKIVETGWIEGVVEYLECGMHRPKWKNPSDFKLVLAAPELLEALEEFIKFYENIIITESELNNSIYRKAEEAINKAKGI